MKGRFSFLLMCLLPHALLLGSIAASSWSQDAQASSAPDFALQAVSGGRYRLAGGAAVLGDPGAECGVVLDTAPEVPDLSADAGGVPAWAMAQGDAWQTSGAASGGGYRLAGLTGGQLQGGTWQVRGGASGGSYSLDAPTAVSSYVGSGCCCTYLPGLMRP